MRGHGAAAAGDSIHAVGEDVGECIDGGLGNNTVTVSRKGVGQVTFAVGGGRELGAFAIPSNAWVPPVVPMCQASLLLERVKGWKV